MPYSTADIRNVCLVGPSHAGKTLLTEALLFAGGKIKEKGSIDKGTTISDYTPREKDIGHSQFNSVCHLDHEGIHVNLIDTPGYRDFFGRALSVLPAAETAAVVINATEGVEELFLALLARLRLRHGSPGRGGSRAGSRDAALLTSPARRRAGPGRRRARLRGRCSLRSGGFRRGRPELRQGAKLTRLHLPDQRELEALALE